MAAMSFLLAITVFCCYYLFRGHTHLSQWYLRLNNCFYRAPYWNTQVFTPAIKSAGDHYALPALITAVSGIAYTIFRLRRNIPDKAPLVITYNIYDILPTAACILSGICLWLWGNHQALPAYDEVFSAQNAAGVHPFQCISYYMLPNNHMGYNLLNNLLFHAASDKVVSGRWLSLICYCAFIVTIFFGLKKLLQNRWFALLLSIALAMQFQVWGFSFQARGYELCLLCEFGMLLSLLGYLYSPGQRWLYLNILCCVAGYFCLPSFLYFHAAQLLFIALYQLCYRKFDLALWKYQLFVFSFAFFCYLPVLCFSGIDVLTHNTYVVPMGDFKTAGDFCRWMFPSLLPYLAHVFSNLSADGHSPVNVLLFFLPLALLFNRKNKMNVLFGLFYLCMWLAFFAIAIIMKRLPFERNLIGHYSIILAGDLLVLYWLTGIGVAKTKGIVRIVLFPTLLVLLAIHFIQTNQVLLKDTLYQYDVNKEYTELSNALSFLPPGTTVGFSDEGFFCCYACKKNGCVVSKCPSGTEAYFIKETAENMPPQLAANYTFLKHVTFYDVYKKN